MCGLSSPKISTPPPAPTVTDASTDNDIRARENTRRRLRGAVGTQTSMLSASGERGKSLLGQ